MTSLIDIPYRVVITAPDSQIAFDCTVTENHSNTLVVTEHPVEEGAAITDHAQREPDDLTLNGIISDQPILLNAEENLKPSVPGGDPNLRAQQAYDEFRRLQREFALLKIATELRDYQNMMITGIAVTRDSSTRHILDINLTLREFRIATVETVDAPEPREPVHRKRRDNGRQNTEPPSDEVTAKAESGFASGANALDKIRGAGGFFGG
jgi:hypothetical protein